MCKVPFSWVSSFIRFKLPKILAQFSINYKLFAGQYKAIKAPFFIIHVDMYQFVNNVKSSGFPKQDNFFWPPFNKILDCKR